MSKPELVPAKEKLPKATRGRNLERNWIWKEPILIWLTAECEIINCYSSITIYYQVK